MQDMDVIQAGVPANDGCPVLTRIKAFIVDRGVRATLQHIFRTRAGHPVDLTPAATSESASESASESESEIAAEPDTVLLRIREFSMPHDRADVTAVSVEGEIVTAASGLVQARLPQTLVDRAGLYRLSWGFVRDGELKLVNDGLLSVEASLFGSTQINQGAGAPTINEIRMHLMDSSGAENLLLDDVEFGDEQIALAIGKPVDHFNEIGPPISTKFTTRNFPYRSHWLDAVTGYLLQFAAHNYRRNRLDTRAGGLSVDDKNKEAEYLRASQLMLERWHNFAAQEKYNLNVRQCVGSTGSLYGRLP